MTQSQSTRDVKGLLCDLGRRCGLASTEEYLLRHSPRGFVDVAWTAYQNGPLIFHEVESRDERAPANIAKVLFDRRSPAHWPRWIFVYRVGANSSSAHLRRWSNEARLGPEGMEDLVQCLRVDLETPDWQTTTEESFLRTLREQYGSTRPSLPAVFKSYLPLQDAGLGYMASRLLKQDGWLQIKLASKGKWDKEWAICTALAAMEMLQKSGQMRAAWSIRRVLHEWGSDPTFTRHPEWRSKLNMVSAKIRLQSTTFSDLASVREFFQGAMPVIPGEDIPRLAWRSGLWRGFLDRDLAPDDAVCEYLEKMDNYNPAELPDAKGNVDFVRSLIFLSRRQWDQLFPLLREALVDYFTSLLRTKEQDFPVPIKAIANILYMLLATGHARKLPKVPAASPLDLEVLELLRWEGVTAQGEGMAEIQFACRAAGVPSRTLAPIGPGRRSIPFAHAFRMGQSSKALMDLSNRVLNRLGMPPITLA